MLYMNTNLQKLSLMLPTLADRDANLEILFLFNFEENIFQLIKLEVYWQKSYY